jgi:hypothetical protein
MNPNITQTAIVQGSRVALIVLMEDELIHTDAHPFCSDFTCPCHQDSDLFYTHITQPFIDGLLAYEEMYPLFHGGLV